MKQPPLDLNAFDQQFPHASKHKEARHIPYSWEVENQEPASAFKRGGAVDKAVQVAERRSDCGR